MVSRQRIAAVEALIRPYVRHTPIVEDAGLVFQARVATAFRLVQRSPYGAQLVVEGERYALGRIGGIAAWYEGRIRIVGVEPRLAPTLTRALEAGRPVDAEAGGIAADSLAPAAWAS